MISYGQQLLAVRKRVSSIKDIIRIAEKRATSEVQLPSITHVCPVNTKSEYEFLCKYYFGTLPTGGTWRHGGGMKYAKVS